MTAVRWVALQDVATIERDIVEPAQIRTGTLYVGLENIESGGRIVNVRRVDAGELASNKFAFTTRHVLFGKLRPYLAKIARPDFVGICSTDILPVLPGTGLDRGYLSWLLLAPEMVSLAASRATGANLPRLSPSALAEMKIPLPPLPEQRRIAEILDKADALRAKRRAALAQLDTLTQSIFLDMFGDPATNPKGWPVRTIGDLLESVSYGTSEKAEVSGEFPVLRMNNITRTGEMDFTDLKYMDLPEVRRERYLVRAGDVLFNRTNSADLVGKTAIFRDPRPMAYAGYLIRLRVNGANDPEYLAAFLNTGFSKRVLRGMCRSIIGMANINATELQAIRIPQPVFQAQREFSRRVNAVRKLRAIQRASLIEEDGLFAALQHRAFRGEL
ncbi:MAG: restriction endonuclease subunit S [Gemmatimonadaceae bacterium]